MSSRCERGGGGDGDRLLAGALHVEAGLPLPLGAVHAVVEDADGDHVLEHLAQGVGVELRVPRADRAMIFVEHPHQLGRQRMGFRRRRGDVGARRRSRGGNVHRREVRRVARTERRLGHVQRESRPVGPKLGGVFFTHVERALNRACGVRQLSPLRLRRSCRRRVLVESLFSDRSSVACTGSQVTGAGNVQIGTYGCLGRGDFAAACAPGATSTTPRGRQSGHCDRWRRPSCL